MAKEGFAFQLLQERFEGNVSKVAGIVGGLHSATALLELYKSQGGTAQDFIVDVEQRNSNVAGTYLLCDVILGSTKLLYAHCLSPTLSLFSNSHNIQSRHQECLPCLSSNMSDKMGVC